MSAGYPTSDVVPVPRGVANRPMPFKPNREAPFVWTSKVDQPGAGLPVAGAVTARHFSPGRSAWVEVEMNVMARRASVVQPARCAVRRGKGVEKRGLEEGDVLPDVRLLVHQHQRALVIKGAYQGMRMVA